MAGHRLGHRGSDRSPYFFTVPFIEGAAAIVFETSFFGFLASLLDLI